ncbi:protein of unknown function [Streptomyces murinus]
MREPGEGGGPGVRSPRPLSCLGRSLDQARVIKEVPWLTVFFVGLLYFCILTHLPPATRCVHRRIQRDAAACFRPLQPGWRSP